MKIKMPAAGEIATIVVKYWGLLGIMYGAVVWVHNKNDRIENSVTQKQLTEVIYQFNEKLDDVSEQFKVIIANQEIANSNTIQINDNFIVIKEEFANHIRESKEIPVDRRLDDIVRIVTGIQVDLKQLIIWPDTKIKIEKK